MEEVEEIQNEVKKLLQENEELNECLQKLCNHRIKELEEKDYQIEQIKEENEKIIKENIKLKNEFKNIKYYETSKEENNNETKKLTNKFKKIINCLKNKNTNLEIEINKEINKKEELEICLKNSFQEITKLCQKMKEIEEEKDNIENKFNKIKNNINELENKLKNETHNNKCLNKKLNKTENCLEMKIKKEKYLQKELLDANNDFNILLKQKKDICLKYNKVCRELATYKTFISTASNEAKNDSNQDVGLFKKKRNINNNCPQNCQDINIKKKRNFKCQQDSLPTRRTNFNKYCQSSSSISKDSLKFDNLQQDSLPIRRKNLKKCCQSSSLLSEDSLKNLKYETNETDDLLKFIKLAKIISLDDIDSYCNDKK